MPITSTMTPFPSKATLGGSRGQDCNALGAHSSPCNTHLEPRPRAGSHPRAPLSAPERPPHGLYWPVWVWSGAAVYLCVGGWSLGAPRGVSLRCGKQRRLRSDLSKVTWLNGAEEGLKLRPFWPWCALSSVPGTPVTTAPYEFVAPTSLRGCIIHLRPPSQRQNGSHDRNVSLTALKTGTPRPGRRQSPRP